MRTTALDPSVSPGPGKGAADLWAACPRGKVGTEGGGRQDPRRGFQGAQPWRRLESKIAEENVRMGSARMPEL